MELVKDTGAEREAKQPDDPQEIGTGSAHAPGGAKAPVRDAAELTHSETPYPGQRPEDPDSQNAAAVPDNVGGGGNARGPGDVNTTKVNGAIPQAGDLDPGATASAEQTGQDGDITEPAKNTGNPWNG